MYTMYIGTVVNPMSKTINKSSPILGAVMPGRFLSRLMPSTIRLRPGQTGHAQERAGERLLQEMFLCAHVRSVKKCIKPHQELLKYAI